MKFQPLFLPLPTLLLTTLSLNQVHPAAALQCPSLPVAFLDFFQQNFTEVRVPTVNIDLEGFLQRAHEFGKEAQSYGEDFLQTAAGSSQEIGRAVTEVKERVQSIVHSVTAWYEELNAPSVLQTDSKRATITADLEIVFRKVLEELKTRFPPPDHAPGHKERVAVVDAALNLAGEALVDVCGKYGMGEDRVRVLWDGVRAPIRTVIVLIGDLAEQHPHLLEGILFLAVVDIIPSSWLLRSLLSIFGFGSKGPAKGSTAAWAQRAFFGAAVKKGSWFAKLQQAGMAF